MLDIDEEARLEEVKFYYTIRNVLKSHNKNIFVIDLIERICEVYNVSSLIIKGLITRVATDKTVAPSKLETVILLHKSDLKYKSINAIFKMDYRTYKNQIKKWEEEYGMMLKFKPQYTDKQRAEMIKFMDALKDIRRIFFNE